MHLYGAIGPLEKYPPLMIAGERNSVSIKMISDVIRSCLLEPAPSCFHRPFNRANDYSECPSLWAWTDVTSSTSKGSFSDSKCRIYSISLCYCQEIHDGQKTKTVAVMLNITRTEGLLLLSLTIQIIQYLK